MELRLDGKTAIVTGGSKGIGKGIAAAFVEAGANVLITARKADALEATAQELGPTCSWIVGHTGRPEDGETVIDAAIERYGSADILVNNAATNPHAGRLIDVPLSMWDKTFEVNLRGPLAWTQIAHTKWMEQHGGSVINIASVGAFKTSSNLGVYGVFKSAMVYMTSQLAAELGPKVRVNCIAPGLIRTDFARILWEGERGKEVANMMPLKRLGEPEDIGQAALFLCTAAPWLTGQTLVLDGGELVRINEASFE